MFSIAYHPKYVHPVPENHRFPMQKYVLLKEQLLYRGIVKEKQFFIPEKIDLDSIIKVHDEDYVHRFIHNQLTKKEERRIGFVQDKAIVERELLLVGGTLKGALLALQNKLSFNIAGGTHHACYAHGEGFCMLNDQGIAAQYLINHRLCKKVLIIDLDVHQGNGTADILGKSKDIYTFSMHCEANYPFEKKKSHKDVALEIGTKDEEYLKILRNSLEEIEKEFKPDFIFYQSGVDILQSDKMGKIDCSLEGCKQRDAIIFQWAMERNIPIQCSMGGGYSEDIKIILEAHTNTFSVANEIYMSFS